MRLGHALTAGRTILSDWRWFPFYLQRRFRRRAHRDAIVRMLASWRGNKPAAEAAPSPLVAEGQDWLGQVFDEGQVREIRAFLEQRRVRDDYRPEVARWLPLGEGRHPHSHVGYHDNEDVVRAPHLLALANRPDILAKVEAFLGCKPTISYMAAWWSYATGLGAQQAENFHRDVDDWRFVKLFVYLTDVQDDTKGPHVYVRRTANVEQIGVIRRYTDEEITEQFGEEHKVKMFADAGEGFLEDTYGFHKGQPVAEGYRLMFQAVYSLVPLPYGPKRPVIGAAEAEQAAGMALDPFVNRVYVARR